MKSFIYLISLSATLQLCAQTTFQKFYFNPDGEELTLGYVPRNIYVDEANGDITTVGNRGLGIESGDLFILNTDYQGNIISSKTYGTDGNQIVRHNEGFYFSDVEGYSVDYICAISKTNSTGEVAWKKGYGKHPFETPSPIAGGSYPRNLFVDSNNNLLLTGQTDYYYDVMDSYADKSIFISLINQEGEILHEKIFGLYYYDLFCSTETSDNNYLSVGKADHYGTDDILIVKFDSELNILWSKILDENDNNERAYDIQEMPNGSFLISGSSVGIDGQINNLLYTMDEFGDLIVQKKINLTDDNLTYSRTSIIENDIYINSTLSDNTSLIYKLDEDLNLVFAKKLSSKITSNITETIDGAFLFGERYMQNTKMHFKYGFEDDNCLNFLEQTLNITNTNLQDSTINLGAYDSEHFVIDYTPTSSSINNLSDSLLCTTLSVPEIESSISLVFPNPITKFLSINQNLKISTYKIYTLIGRKVMESNTIKESINISNLTEGTYIVELTTMEDEKFITKFIKN